MRLHNSEMTGIVFLENYLIEVTLKNGHRIVYNLNAKIKTARFQDLLESEIFFCGELVNGNRIRWMGNIEISLEEILKQVTEGVNSPEMNLPANEKGIII